MKAGVRRGGVPAAVLGAVMAGAAAALPGGCAAPPTSTRLEVQDIEYTASELSSRLSESDWLRDRTPDSPRVVVAITKVENLSSDVIPEADRWYIMTRLRQTQGVEQLRRLRNIVFVVPLEHLGGAQASEADRDVAEGRRPTHEMSATFRSSTRAAGLDRTDAYLCELRITDLTTRELAWTGIVEFKKVAHGKSYD